MDKMAAMMNVDEDDEDGEEKEEKEEPEEEEDPPETESEESESESESEAEAGSDSESEDEVIKFYQLNLNVIITVLFYRMPQVIRKKIIWNHELNVMRVVLLHSKREIISFKQMLIVFRMKLIKLVRLL